MPNLHTMSLLKRYIVQLDVEHMLVSAAMTFTAGFLGAIVMQLPTLQENFSRDLFISVLAGAFTAGIKSSVQIVLLGLSKMKDKLLDMVAKRNSNNKPKPKAKKNRHRKG